MPASLTAVQHYSYVTDTTAMLQTERRIKSSSSNSNILLAGTVRRGFICTNREGWVLGMGCEGVVGAPRVSDQMERRPVVCGPWSLKGWGGGGGRPHVALYSGCSCSSWDSAPQGAGGGGEGWGV